jgi:hypothetical protein
MLRKIFVIRADKWEVVQKLHNENLHDLYFSPNNIILNNQEIRYGWDMWHLRGDRKTSRK